MKRIEPILSDYVYSIEDKEVYFLPEKNERASYEIFPIKRLSVSNVLLCLRANKDRFVTKTTKSAG
jgi:hypothetical protein